MFDFSGKTAVITGAGGAIGGEIARGLTQAGAGVAIWDIDPDAARRKADEISTATGGQVLAVECDAVLKSSVEAALDKTVAHFGTVDMLVNGAGGDRKVPPPARNLSSSTLIRRQLARVST